MKKYLLVLLLIGELPSVALSQGCVAVRGMSCSVGTGTNGHAMMHPGQWQISMGFRNLHSYKHFVGTVHQPHREVAGTNVINDQQAFDFGVNYSVTDRFSVAFNLPVTFNNRTSLYEHYGNAVAVNPQQRRFATQSNGIGDARFTASYWVLDPIEHMKGNFSVGLGVKLPTGNWNVQDKFHRRRTDGTDHTITKAVDQSIQLGDGGLGFNLELQGYQQLFSRTSLYYNGFYLSNPRNVNSASNVAPDRTVTDPMVQYMSAPDQYAARVGLNYVVSAKAGIGATLGSRIEGIPAYDLLGGSDGFRRPGYIVSIEPGLSYSSLRNSYFVSVPIATYRNRIKSANDWKTGRHGDAAFADYLISVSMTHRF